MHLRRSISTLLAPLLAAFAVAAGAQTPPPAPDVSLTFGSPPYSYAASCDLAKPLVFLHLTATNREGGSAPFVVAAADQSGTLAGGVSVPALAPGASTVVSVPLQRVGSSPASALTGEHAISVFVRGRPARVPLSLPFPASLCSPLVRAALSDSVTNARPIGLATPQVFSHTNASAAHAVLAALQIAPPANVRSVASGPDCGAHVGAIGALVCPDMMKSGDLLLIWDWQPADGPGEIDGYRIYTGNGINVQSGAFVGQLVATRPNKGVTLFDIPKPPGGKGYAGNCFAVTAYAGSRESKPSAPFCAGGDNVAKTATFTPVRQLSISRHTYDNHERPPINNTQRGYGVVGYNYYAIGGGIAADASFAWISRYAMLFDVRSLMGRRLFEAHVTLNVQAAPDTRPDCTNSVGFGTSDWWTEGWPDGTFGTPSMTLLNNQLKIELTNTVSNWMAGRFNQGIILRNNDENLYAFTQKRCETRYTNPILSITYY